MASSMDVAKARGYADRLITAKTYDEIDAICSEIIEDEKRQNYQPKSWSDRVSPINAILKEFPVEQLKINENAFIQIKQNGDQWLRHYYFKSIGIADTNWGEINQQAGENKLEALTNKQEILVSKYLETACKLLQSKKPHELAVGLIAVSGRRPIEILSLADFNKKKSFKDMPAGVLDKAKNLNIDYYVNFSGQAKRGDNDLEDGEKLKYPIGLLVPVDAFLNAFNRLRSMPECLDITRMVYKELDKGNTRKKINEMIENRRGNSLRRVVQEYFDFLPPKEGEKNVTNKALRACYVKLITDRDCPKTIDDLLWASRSVGHFIDVESPDKNKLMDLITTLNYRYYYTNENVPFVNLEVAPIEASKAIRGFVGDADNLISMVDKFGFSSQMQAFRYVLNKAEESLELEAKIAKLQLRVKELESMQVQAVETIKEVPVETVKEVVKEVEVIKEVETVKEVPVIAADVAELIRLEVEKQVKEVLKNYQPVTTETKPEVKAETKPVTTPKVDDTDWEGMSNKNLWETKKQGASDEKIRRSFLAVCRFNGENSSYNLPKIAITNQILRDLSRCNGQLVGNWMKQHESEIIDHNTANEMLSSPGQLETRANRKVGADTIKQILEIINNQFLDGQGLNSK